MFVPPITGYAPLTAHFDDITAVISIRLLTVSAVVAAVQIAFDGKLN